MRLRFRRAVEFLAFLGILALAVSSRSRLLDGMLVCAFWAALLMGSAAAVVKTWQSRRAGGQGRACCGQASALPQRWQRWLTGETGSAPESCN
jgi:hypothetical protein